MDVFVRLAKGILVHTLLCMTNRETVLNLLNAVSPAPLTNSEISQRANITPHQQVFQITEALVQEGLIEGFRDGHEWSFRATKDVSSHEPIRQHVQNIAELYESSTNFQSLEHGTVSEQKFYNGRIKNAKRFVVLSEANDNYNFAPGAYAAYRGSKTVEEWKSLGTKVYRGQGRLYLDRVLNHCKVDEGHVQYQDLCEKFAQFCAVRGIEPSVHEDPLSFWLVGPDTEFLDSGASVASEWTDAEFAAAVNAYSDMLRMEQAGTTYNRSALEKTLQREELSQRSDKSVFFRMRNISAVLKSHGMPTITAYSPADNVGPHGKEIIEHYLRENGHLPAIDNTIVIPATPNQKVYIANFGRGNYEWPVCKERNTVATMIHEDTRQFYDADDRESFIEWCVANSKAASGLVPTRAVASRWFGAMETIENTSGDIWFHRADDGLWWTTSKPDVPDWELKPILEPAQTGLHWVCHKPCQPWSNLNRKGNRLEWDALHPKAKSFLFTEGTLQKLTPDNAAYALALIHGKNLSEWESRPEWKLKAQKASKSPVTIYNAWERTVVRIIKTVVDTTNNANGQTVERTMKNKDLGLSEQDLKEHLEELKIAQDGLCAITGIPIQFDGEADDPQLLCSLDRIDSSGHYERGNLQLVCRFINFWKNNSNDFEFRRLIEFVRTQGL